MQRNQPGLLQGTLDLLILKAIGDSDRRARYDRRTKEGQRQLQIETMESTNIARAMAKALRAN